MKKIYFVVTLAVLVSLISCKKENQSIIESQIIDVCVGTSLLPSIDGVPNTKADEYTIPQGYKIRYILEAWSTDENPFCACRSVTVTEELENIQFSFRIVKGTYNFLIWADFVPDNFNGTKDMHYETSDGLIAVKVKVDDKNQYIGCDISRDAFAATILGQEIEKDIQLTAQLKRPLAKLTINNDDVSKVEGNKSVSITFETPLPDTYNVLTGIATNSGERSILPIFPNTKVNSVIAFDYLFVTAIGETQHNCSFTYDSKTITSIIPIQINKQTNVTAKFTTNNP